MAQRGSRPDRPARERVLEAALDLFAEQGVSGTSLQMIADRMGVTKAAVYHQFRTKEDIVFAVVGPALDRLLEIADAIDAEPDHQRRFTATLAGIIDLIITHRRLAAIVQFDPMVARLVRGHPAHASFERIRSLFTGPDPDGSTLVAAAMVSGGLIVAGVDPALVRLSDDELREHLFDTATRLLRPPPGPPSAAG
ncbi:TetR/AcrR family transcriptional regulator [Catellatospora coxensis]|uniref:TetR family transcriptional regulator n=1 Tax=Catellatospora coxensis TaxID=310354 RepID=A0A8J3L3I0_9ACTN|nr:TetR/AcrR family transcriptional regulator [Catellatospora coxensis]GIG08304.1 TetR family transcriptional regulator [Catellatospora coxensis]